MNPWKPEVLWSSLERVRFSLNASDEVFADWMGISTRQFRRLRSQRKSPPAAAFFDLAEHLQVSAENLFSGQIDLGALLKRAGGDKAAIPERYLAGAHSRLRTAVDLILYLGFARGPAFVRRILRQFEVPEAALTDPERLINLRFLTDVCDFLGSYGFTASDFSEIGRFMASSPANRAIRSQLQGCRTSREVFDLQLNFLMFNYDENFFYRTPRMHSDNCVIEVKERPNVLSELGTQHLGSVSLCSYREGRISAIPSLVGLPFAKITKTRCVHQGDTSCVYHAEYPSSIRLIRR